MLLALDRHLNGTIVVIVSPPRRCAHAAVTAHQDHTDLESSRRGARTFRRA
jgi:hypothetical protein